MVSKKATRKSAKRPKAAKPLKKASTEEVPTAPVKKGVGKAKARKSAKEEEEEPKEEPESATDNEEDKKDKKKNKTKANRLKKMQEEDEEDEEEKIDRGIVFIAHCPDGLYEPQLKLYLSQFGTVTNVRLGRSQKTGRTKGHAWVEFEDIEVAKIVAQTLNGYLLEGKSLLCKVMTTDQVHRKFWRKSKLTQFIHDGPRKRRADAKIKNDRPTIEVDGDILPQQTLNQIVRQDNNVEKLQANLEELGIDYDLSPFLIGKGHPVVEAALREREKAREASEEVKSTRKVKAAAEVVQKLKAKAATAEAEADRGEAAEGEAAEEEDKAQASRKGKKGRKAAQSAAAAESADAVEAAPEADKEEATPVRKRKKAGEARNSAASAEVEEKADADDREPAAPAAEDEAGEAQKPRPKKKKKQLTA